MDISRSENVIKTIDQAPEFVLVEIITFDPVGGATDADAQLTRNSNFPKKRRRICDVSILFCRSYNIPWDT